MKTAGSYPGSIERSSPPATAPPERPRESTKPYVYRGSSARGIGLDPEHCEPIDDGTGGRTPWTRIELMGEQQLRTTG